MYMFMCYNLPTQLHDCLTQLLTSNYVLTLNKTLILIMQLPIIYFDTMYTCIHH